MTEQHQSSVLVSLLVQATNNATSARKYYHPLVRLRYITVVSTTPDHQQEQQIANLLTQSIIQYVDR